MEMHGTTLRVVIADDSSLVRERMVSLLREIPRVEVVAETADVPETIAAVRRLLPHAIILDISMPGGCGLDVLDQIRAERIPSLVVVLTNYSDPEYEVRARRDGAVAFLDKSRDFLKAVDYVRDLAERNLRHHDLSSVAQSPSNGMNRHNTANHPEQAAVQSEVDETLDMVYLIRDTIRDFKSRAERQNASIRLSHSTGFIYPVEVVDDLPDLTISESAPGCADPCA